MRWTIFLVPSTSMQRDTNFPTQSWYKMQCPCAGKTSELLLGAPSSSRTAWYRINMGSTLMHEPETKHNHDIVYSCTSAKVNDIQRLLVKGTSLDRRSCMACVVKEFNSFTCTPTNGMNHTCFCFPRKHLSSFTYSGGMEGWVDPGTTSE